MNFDHFFLQQKTGLLSPGWWGLASLVHRLSIRPSICPAWRYPFYVISTLNWQKKAFLDAGIDEGDIVTADSVPSALRAFETGKKVITDDYRLLCEVPADIIVEATGQPEAAASIAYLALTSGYHVAMVTKEADIVLGPYLSHIAAQSGRLITPVDGDQPSLLIGLMSWANMLGLEVLAAGKSSEYDFIYHPERDMVSWRGQEKHVPDFKEVWAMGSDPAATLAQAWPIAGGFSATNCPGFM